MLMHHQIAGGKVGEGLQLLPVGVLFQLPLFLGDSSQLPFRQNGQLQRRPFASGGQSADGDP